MPCFFSPSRGQTDCECKCNKLEGCVAFDIHYSNCNLRFGSKNALLASPNPSGYRKFVGGCGNKCADDYEGGGRGGSGPCWVKNKGNFIMSLTLFGGQV